MKIPSPAIIALLLGIGLGFLGGWLAKPVTAPVSAAKPGASSALPKPAPTSALAELMLSDLQAIAADGNKPGPNAALSALVDTALAMEPKTARLGRLAWLFSAMTLDDVDELSGKCTKLYYNQGQYRADETTVFHEHWVRLEGMACFERWDAQGNGWAAGRGELAQLLMNLHPEQADALMKAAEHLQYPEEIRKAIPQGLIESDASLATQFLLKHAALVPPDPYAEPLAKGLLKKRGIVATSQWVNGAQKAGLSTKFTTTASNIIDGVMKQMATESWVASLKNRGAAWPTAETFEKTAEYLATKVKEPQHWSKFMPLWTTPNPDVPGLWLKSQTGKPHYDAATAAFARSIQPVDPTAAAAWVETIVDPKIKASALAAKSR